MSFRLDNPAGYTREHAILLNEQDPLKHIRNEFIIPTKEDLFSEKLADLGLFYLLASARSKKFELTFLTK